MAFSYAVNNTKHLAGDVWMVTGTFTNAAGSTGGNIVTGLSNVFFFNMQETGAAVSADRSVVNETYSTSLGYYSTGSGTLTVVNTANVDGTWVAFGTF